MTKTPAKIAADTSREANKDQLKLALDEGESYERALKQMQKQTGIQLTQTVRDYIISFTTEKSEGMYVWEAGQLVWREPETENAHLEVIVQDALDKRFVPYLEVTVTIYNHSNEIVLSEQLPFVWHPWLYHYGKNVSLPGDGSYKVDVDVSELPCGRHDRANGQRLSHMANAHFERVPISTGRR